MAPLDPISLADLQARNEISQAQRAAEQASQAPAPDPTPTPTTDQPKR
ncbi:hypothetical protein [Streptomyces sp. BE230]|nr:hypothetical protein [Streptomyces sp. BE230]